MFSGIYERLLWSVYGRRIQGAYLKTCGRIKALLYRESGEFVGLATLKLIHSPISVEDMDEVAFIGLSRELFNSIVKRSDVEYRLIYTSSRDGTECFATVTARGSRDDEVLRKVAKAASELKESLEDFGFSAFNVPASVVDIDRGIVVATPKYQIPIILIAVSMALLPFINMALLPISIALTILSLMLLVDRYSGYTVDGYVATINGVVDWGSVPEKIYLISALGLRELINTDGQLTISISIRASSDGAQFDGWGHEFFVVIASKDKNVLNLLTKMLRRVGIYMGRALLKHHYVNMFIY